MDSSNQQCNNNTPRSSTQKNNDSSKKRKLQTFHINIPIMHRPPNESQSMSFNKYRAYCQKEFSMHKKKMREIEDVISSSGGIVPESIRNLNLNYATNNNSKGSSSEEGEDGQEWSWEDFDSNLEFLPEDYAIDYLEEGRKEIADENIIQQMPIYEISNLVGIANGLAVKEGTEEMSNEQTRMWHIPHVPPQPKHLDFILKCAASKLHTSEMQAKERCAQLQKASTGYYEKVEFRVDEDSSDEEGIIDDCFSDDDSIYKKFKDFKPMKKVSGWKYENKGNKTQHKTKKDDRWKKYQDIYTNFDETALISLGMLYEECLVESLLPLARKHVERCRSIDDSSLKTRNQTSQTGYNKANNKTAFDQWTLPPEEAITQIFQRSKQSFAHSSMSKPSLLLKERNNQDIKNVKLELLRAYEGEDSSTMHGNWPIPKIEILYQDKKDML